MFNSTALDAVIGLITIYLLYSLLGTVLSEMIASVLGLRSRHLKAAISRMLNDEKSTGWFRRMLNSLNIMRSADNRVVNSFYDNPEIKNLCGPGLIRDPSFIKAGSFSKALVAELSVKGTINEEAIRAALSADAQKSKNAGTGTKEPVPVTDGSAGYILGLWQESGSDIAKFRILLADWFNRTMEQATEWYKRKIQIVLMILGFCMAWFFYADTFVIVKSLSNDKKAREQMVSLANTYLQSGLPGDSSLIEIKIKLDADISKANTILGLGGWLPGKIRVATDARTKEKQYKPALDPDCLSVKDRKISNGTLILTFGDKLNYLFRLAYHHFFGFLLTAVAVSLGAPFWFDILNKVMKFRGSVKK